MAPPVSKKENNNLQRNGNGTIASQRSSRCDLCMSAQGGCIEVPEDHGLWIRFKSKTLSLEIEQDENYPTIHPNCYAPASLTNVHLLKGSGSGTAVFGGESPTLGKIVMKHGGSKDTKEVFSLAQISQELERRLLAIEGSKEAVEDTRRRIPEFVGCYISLHHLRNRTKELWYALRETAFRRMMSRNSSDTGTSSDEDDEDFILTNTTDIGEASFRVLKEKQKAFNSEMMRKVAFRIEQEKKRRRGLHVCRGEDVGFEILFRKVILHIPHYHDDGTIKDLNFLQELARELAEDQDSQLWKVTLAQKAIGGPYTENGAVVLAGGKLKGKLLDILLDEYNTVIQNLRKITFPEERGSVDTIREELGQLEITKDVKSISDQADTFVGTAIRKNFMPKTGRFAQLRDFGNGFRIGDLVLTAKEQVPAEFLGMLLEPGASLAAVFAEPPALQSALDAMEDSWLDLLRHATSLKSRSAVDRVWTSGLTDAGLHNTFLSEEQGLELFDLGEPQIIPLPAFLTKFFMSFFQTLGMEEDASGSWVRRFYVSGGKLQLTADTTNLLSYVYESFGVSLDHLIREIFGGDKSVRQLIIKYTVLQLLSDTSFCLGRWEQKGGGKKRLSERAQCTLEKWLWRSLWDLYIASDVHKKLLVHADH